MGELSFKNVLMAIVLDSAALEHSGGKRKNALHKIISVDMFLWGREFSNLQIKKKKKANVFSLRFCLFDGEVDMDFFLKQATKKGGKSIR